MSQTIDKQITSILQNIIDSYKNITSITPNLQTTYSLQDKLHQIKLLFDLYKNAVQTMLKQRKTDQQYEGLQKQLQRQQADIRNHIRLQQQLKLYTESMQTKLDQYQKQKQKTEIDFKQRYQELRNRYQKLLQQKPFKERDVNLEQIYSKSKLPYNPLKYQHQNKKTPVKYNTIYTTSKLTPQQNLNNSTFNNSTYLVRNNTSGYQIQQQPKYIPTYHTNYNTNNQQRLRSASRQQVLRKNSRINSIHILPKKTSIYCSMK